MGVAAQVLKALVGDVVIEPRQVEGQENSRMVARFAINAVPALAVLDRHAGVASNDAPQEIRAAVDDVAQPAEIRRAKEATKAGPIVSLAYERKDVDRKAARNRDGAT